MKQLALIFLLLSVFAGSAAAQNRENDNSRGSKGLIFTLRTERVSYALGETVTATLTWENATKKKIEIPTSPMSGHVRVFNAETKAEVRYEGGWACGTGETQKIAAGEKFEISNTLNHFLRPNFDLVKPGRYTISPDYGSCCSEQREPSATFEIVRLDEEALKREREKALAGDARAVQILSAHGDESIVPVLGALAKSSDEKMRQTVYRALLILNTEASMQVLGEAANARIPVTEKMELLMSLKEMQPVPNASLIFYMRKLLDDSYVGGYTTLQKAGEAPKRYKEYTFRIMAAQILKRFDIEVQVVEREEVKEDSGKR